ncbi:glycosyltransferase [Butyricicoccus faecihominis]|uniref:glycosyltransferase n=1 Tax=Butyricicoccus faecihominis TaxID=1712515 RepID=UPI0024789D90|nr:glycosyltransferase [Butyricicoccus faecihominis]MCQ5129398.1 glycosyltransferase [Butyricicoccus faecihominis]
MTSLVTIVVLCYKNFKYIYQTLDSVFAQDYENIELIISDDGSADFPEERIRTYVERHCTPQIISWKINRNEKNVGTVKHLNIVSRMARGEYFISVSADDMIDHEDVISRCVKKLSSKSEADILMTQTAMYDEKMKHILYYFVQPHIRDILLHQQTSNALYNELVQHPYLPSVSTFFSHTFFEKYGYFDESYDLIEDWSLHLKLARKHVPIMYCDFVSIRHRSGGISHGNSTGNSQSYKRYLQDLQKTYCREIQPYLNQVTPEIREQVRHKHHLDSAWIDWQTKYKGHGIKGLFLYLIHNFDIEVYKHIPDIYYKAKGKQWIPLIVGLILSCFGGWFASILGESSVLLFSYDMGITAAFTIVLSLFSNLLIIGGLLFLVLYYLAAAFSMVIGNMQLYF